MNDVTPQNRSRNEVAERIKKTSLTIPGPTRIPNQESETDVITRRRTATRVSMIPPTTARIMRRSTPVGLELLEPELSVALKIGANPTFCSVRCVVISWINFV